MNDNIKVINFNKNIINSENEINEIVFNNSNTINNNFFKENQKDIIIEENVALENKDLVYKDDSIYIQELENDLLSMYPVTKQNSKYIIEKVQDKAKNIVELKNSGVKKNNLIKNNFEYQKKLDIVNNDFSDTWVIPITFDNHIVFSNIINKTLENNNNLNERLITQLVENSSNSIEIEQKELINELNLNNQNFEEKKITLQKYEEINSKLYKSFTVKYDQNSINKKGFLIHPKNSFNVIRFTDLFTNNWNSHKVLDDFNTPSNIYDEDGKIIGIEKNLLIKCEEQNIYGFMVLKEGGNNVLSDYNDILYDDVYGDNLNSVLYNRRKIENINQEDKNLVKITVIDHGLNNDCVIYLKNTNCYPKIDGFYNTNSDLKIINKDTIQIRLKYNLIFKGNSGSVYKLSSLKYDYYNIDNELNINFMHTTYDINEENINHNKLYIFDNLDINKNKYTKILKKIIPSIDVILETENENINNCNNLQQVKKILNKYFLKLEDLNNDQYNNILKKLIEKYNVEITFNKNIKYEKINFLYKNIEFLDNNNYYLNNSYLLENEVKKYYGEYPYKNTSFDSILLRYNWIKSHGDYGDLYIKLLLLKQQDKNKNFIKYVENKINQTKELIKNIEKNIIKEDFNDKNKCKIYKYQALKVDEIDLYDKNYEYYFYDNNLYEFIDDKYKLVNDISDNDMLLLDNLELWSFKKNKWEFTKEYSKYNKIEYLCKFRNIDIDELDLDSLDCIYRKDFGCLSKASMRNKNKLKDYENILYLFEDLYSNLKKNKKKEILNEVEKYVIKHSLGKTYKQNNKIIKKVNNIKSSNSSIPVDILIRKIFKLKNIPLRENYFYDIIEKDCLLVNHNLYSKKYNKKILCGHYHYLKKIYYSDNDNDRQRFIDTLISEYSDQGESEKNCHTCKFCGEKLVNNDYDETEGFSQTGALIYSREIWKKEKHFDLSKESIEEYLESDKVVDCNDDKFKELLLKNGLSIDNIDNAISVGNFITKNLYPKIGVSLPNGVLINNIIDIIQKISLIIPFSIFKMKEMSKLSNSGISKSRIEKMESKKYFEEKYKIFYEIKKQSVICSRILISIQVNIPNLTRKNKLSSCEFYSFSEKDGIEFLACVLKEINQKLSLNKEDILGKYISFIKDYYDNFKSYAYIRELFLEKKKYILSLKRDKIYDIIDNKKNKIVFDKEPKKLNISILKNFKNIKNYKEFEVLFNDLNRRLIYVNLQIKDIIDDVISKSELSDRLPSLLEKSCCAQDVSTYIDFYQYFQIFDSKTKIFDLIDESNMLYQMYNIKLLNYCYHRIKLYDEKKIISTCGDINVYDGKQASNKFIESIFVHYVDEGEYKGTPRDYVEEYKGINEQSSLLKDTKSGKYLDDIKNNEYTVDELNDLLKSIEVQNMKFLDYSENKDENIFTEEEINELKKNSINGLGIQVNLLIQNLVNILGKTKDYETKLFNIINKFYTNEDNFNNNLTVKQRLNINNTRYNNKLNYYKKLYLKLSKYLSIIKNQFEFDIDKKLNIINEPSKRSEMKSQIIEENSKLNSLLIPEISSKFQNIDLKYNINKINSIYGVRNVMDRNGNKVIKQSSFNNYDASILVSYLYFEQLNLLFDSDGQSINKIVLFSKSIKNKHIAQFINILMEEMEEDYNLFEVCNKNNEFEHLDARFYNAYQLKILTSDDKSDVKDFLKKMSESTGVSQDSDYNTLENEIETSEQKKDIIDSITDIKKFDEIKGEYIQNNDEELDLVSLKQIKNRMDKENEFDQEVEIDGFVNDGELKNKDILDTGDEYGSLAEFDFETGEGFPDAEYE